MWNEVALLEREDIGKNEKLIYMCLSAFAFGNSNRCNPGLRRLCRMSGLSINSVRKAIKALEWFGLIEVIPGDRDHTNEYILKTARSPEELAASEDEPYVNPNIGEGYDD
jgi:DNA-binding MarR family transcriptional regulator